MKIEEHGELTTFELPPSHIRLWFALVRWGENHWTPGPSSIDKQTVIEQLSGGYRGVTEARIYSTLVPVRIPLDKDAEGER